MTTSTRLAHRLAKMLAVAAIIYYAASILYRAASVEPHLQTLLISIAAILILSAFAAEMTAKRLESMAVIRDPFAPAGK